MEQQQTFKENLSNILKNKAKQNSTYRKALIIYETILQSSKEIPNFEESYVKNSSNFALFVFGSVLKLVPKDLINFKYSIDSIFLLFSQTLPLINVATLKTTGILKQLQVKVFTIIKNYHGQERTPLMIRLGTFILGFTLINMDKIEKDIESSEILCYMFNFAVRSHRTNVLSKQASKMLIGLVKDNENIGKILSKYVNIHLLTNIESNLYLNNVREVIDRFPFQLINDIGYRVCKHLKTIECVDENQEIYLAQTYYFLQKLSQKFSAQTLQQICKQLISNIPSSIKNQNKVIYCYIQALHGIFSGLMLMNEKVGNRYISIIVSILQEFILKGDKIEKQVVSIMKSIMLNCIKKSLWVANTQLHSQEAELQNFVQMGLHQEKDNNFVKVVSLLQGMLCDEYPNYKSTANILISFFSSLDKTSFDGVLSLIDKIINFRQKFEQKWFRNLMGAIFDVFGVRVFCEIYRIGVSGDVSDENFQARNNLWLIYCTERYDGQEDFHIFMMYYFPLLQSLKTIISNSDIPLVRIDAYKAIIEMIWRSLKIFCRKPNDQYNYDSFIQSIKKQIQQPNDNILIHIGIGLENLCMKLYEKQYQCKWSNNLISLLAKKLDVEKNSNKEVLKVIKYLAMISEKQYLNRVFDKNIIKLIQEKEKGTLCDEANMKNNLKNMEILIAVSNGINFYDPSVIAPYQVSREELVVRLIGDLVAENTVFQKKAYKYMFETIGLMGQGYLNEVIGLLEANQHRVMGISKHYRLAILMSLWSKLSKNDDRLSQAFEFMKKYLPQILMDMRQSNLRSRKQATLIFQSFCTKILEMGLLNNFVQIICAGLAVDSLEMKISTLNGLTAIYEKNYEIAIEYSLEILGIVLILLYEQKNQLYRGVLEFTRKFINMYQKNKEIQNILMTILGELFKVNQSIKLENRTMLKHFLLKLIKKFGRDRIEKCIPKDDRKIVSNAVKIDNREKRKKKEKVAQRRLENLKKKQGKQESSDSEDNGQDVNNDKGEQMDIQNQNKQQLRQLQNPDNLLLKYDLQKQNFHFEQDKLQIKNPFKNSKTAKNKQSDAITFQNGLMVIKEDPRRIKQHKISDDQQQQEQNYAERYNPFINVKKRIKFNDIHEVKESGETYRSNRAGGDVKIKDKPQPYAFIQFNSKALNKRFKKKAEKVFDTIFQRSQGGLKGIKSKITSKGHYSQSFK